MHWQTLAAVQHAQTLDEITADLVRQSVRHSAHEKLARVEDRQHEQSPKALAPPFVTSNVT